MLCTAILGLLLGIFLSRRFNAASIGVAALLAAAWIWAVELITANGIFRATFDALLLTWSLETGLLVGLLLSYHFIRRDRRTVSRRAATAWD
jgi:hypothetical protein